MLWPCRHQSKQNSNHGPSAAQNVIQWRVCRAAVRTTPLTIGGDIILRTERPVSPPSLSQCNPRLTPQFSGPARQEKPLLATGLPAWSRALRWILPHCIWRRRMPASGVTSECWELMVTVTSSWTRPLKRKTPSPLFGLPNCYRRPNSPPPRFWIGANHWVSCCSATWGTTPCSTYCKPPPRMPPFQARLLLSPVWPGPSWRRPSTCWCAGSWLLGLAFYRPMTTRCCAVSCNCFQTGISSATRASRLMTNRPPRYKPALTASLPPTLTHPKCMCTATTCRAIYW